MLDVSQYHIQVVHQLLRGNIYWRKIIDISIDMYQIYHKCYFYVKFFSLLLAYIFIVILNNLIEV